MKQNKYCKFVKLCNRNVLTFNITLQDIRRGDSIVCVSESVVAVCLQSSLRRRNACTNTARTY